MFQIDIKPEDINKAVSEAIIKSTFGERFSKSFSDAINTALTGYDSPVKKMAQDEVTKAIREALQNEPWKTKVQEMIAKYLTVDYVEKVMGNALNKAMKELGEGRY